MVAVPTVEFTSAMHACTCIAGEVQAVVAVRRTTGVLTAVPCSAAMLVTVLTAPTVR